MMIKKIQLLVLGTIIILTSGCIAISTVASVSQFSAVYNDRRTTGTIVDDKTLDFFLTSWITKNPVAKGGHINFLVYNRVVLLSGEVPDKATKAAVKDAMLKEQDNIVLAINELAVAPNSKITTRLRDVQIELTIKTLFYDQDVFHPSHIHLAVERGNVYLMGSVTKREAKRAVKQVKKVGGVKRIVQRFNYLKQRPRAEIERAKKREQQAAYQTERAKKRKELQAQKQKIQKELDELEKTP